MPGEQCQPAAAAGRAGRAQRLRRGFRSVATFASGRNPTRGGALGAADHAVAPAGSFDVQPVPSARVDPAVGIDEVQMRLDGNGPPPLRWVAHAQPNYDDAPMSDDRVIYNGVSMTPDWPDRIRAGQETPMATVAGGVYLRVRFGTERRDYGADRGPCHDCGVVKGQLHDPGCDVRTVPTAHGQFISCDCGGPEVV